MTLKCHWCAMRFLRCKICTGKLEQCCCHVSNVIFLSCSENQQEADVPLSSQRCHPKQQEERTWIRQRLWDGPHRCLLSCCQVWGDEVKSKCRSWREWLVLCVCKGPELFGQEQSSRIFAFLNFTFCAVIFMVFTSFEQCCRNNISTLKCMFCMQLERLPSHSGTAFHAPCTLNACLVFPVCFSDEFYRCLAVKSMRAAKNTWRDSWTSGKSATSTEVTLFSSSPWP